MDEPQKHAKYKKPDVKDYMWFHLCEMSGRGKMSRDRK